MRLPKLRELKEAVTVVFSSRFTTRFPAQPCTVPERYRGRPEIDTDDCIGCGACVNVCPTESLTQTDDLQAEAPVRKITCRYDTCIFCGNCQDNCTTTKGIKLSNQWDLAGLDRKDMSETFEFALQMCEKCGACIGTRKHLVWLAEKLGPLAYTNPAILLAKSADLLGSAQSAKDAVATAVQNKTDPNAGDFMRILCPQCKRELNIRL